MSFIGVQMARQRGVDDMTDKGVTVRPSSTAAFMVNSIDRDQYGDAVESSGNFTIYKGQALFNGFFKRISLQEIILDWSVPNIALHPSGVDLARFTFTFQNPPAPATQYTVTLPTGFYTVEECLDELVKQMNAAIGVAAMKIGGVPGRITMEVDQTVVPGGVFQVNDVPPQNLEGDIFGERQLDLPLAQSLPITSPDIRFTRYLDFVSSQLTYNQDLKDNTTSVVTRDVLYRWNMSDDNVPLDYDAYGFPILQGYRGFVKRRLIAYPKQIMWNDAQPIGSVSFQVFTDASQPRLLDVDAYPLSAGTPEMEFQMTLLLSEN